MRACVSRGQEIHTLLGCCFLAHSSTPLSRYICIGKHAPFWLRWSTTCLWPTGQRTQVTEAWLYGHRGPVLKQNSPCTCQP
ncbi:(Z)-gamma-bisabolene synthase 1, partial [Clarias magur]